MRKVSREREAAEQERALDSKVGGCDKRRVRIFLQVVFKR